MSPGADRVFVRVLELESGSARKKTMEKGKEKPETGDPP
jgi:hypothetical protein